MIAEFRDYLKTLDVADYYYIGKIENIKEKVLGIYADSPTRRVEAIGGNGSYGTFGVRLLLHWNKNANETEISARNLYEKIRYIKDVNMANPDISALVTEDDEVIETHNEERIIANNSVHVQFIDWYYDEPIFVGTDANGVYEYVITGTIYYRKEQ